MNVFPIEVEAARLDRLSRHDVDGTAFELVRVQPPAGETEQWGAAPAYWYRVGVAGRLFGPPLTLTVSEGGASTRWRVPVGAGRGRVAVFADDLPSALLLARADDQRAREVEALAGMYGAGERVHRGGRTFRLVVDPAAIAAGGPVWVDVLEAEVRLTRARPYAVDDGAVYWQFPYEPPRRGDHPLVGLDDGSHAASVGGMLDTLIAGGAVPFVSGDVVRRLRGDLDRVCRRLGDVSQALSADQRRTADLGELAQQAGAVVDLLTRAAEDLDRIGRRPRRSCESPRGGCPEHGATLETLGPYNGRLHSRCTRASCPRAWTYDRLDERCDLPATHRAHAPEPDDHRGAYGVAEVCAGHGERLLEWGWSVRTIPGTAGASPAADAELAERCRRAARRRSGVTAVLDQVVALGYRARETDAPPPSDAGVFPPIAVQIIGHAVSAGVEFVHDAARDLYVWHAGWTHHAGSARVPTWPALLETLAVRAGAPVPDVVVMARRGTLDVVDVAQDLNAVAAPLAALGFLVPFKGDPLKEALLTVIGYGHTFTATYRLDADLGASVFAGAWGGEDGAAEAPSTWSTWAPFLTRLKEIADGAADAVD